MNQFLQIVLLALVQGIAEFLPVSSSGHLAVLGRLTGLEEEQTVLVVVVLHAGTLAAILLYYYRRIFSLLTRQGSRVIFFLIVGTLPAVVTGLSIKLSGLEDVLFNNLFVPGFGFLVTGTVLLLASAASGGKINSLSKIGFGRAFLIGCAQAIAVLPGISRSGTTVSAALRQGVSGEEAAAFSFLLAIPAIGGATFLELLSAFRKGGAAFSCERGYFLLLGFVISAVTGYFALWLLVFCIRKGRLKYFAYYCFTLGLVVLAWALWDVLN